MPPPRISALIPASRGRSRQAVAATMSVEAATTVVCRSSVTALLPHALAETLSLGPEALQPSQVLAVWTFLVHAGDFQDPRQVGEGTVVHDLPEAFETELALADVRVS